MQANRRMGRGGFWTTLVLTGLLAAPAAAQDFPDMRDHWAGEVVATLARQGMVTGYPDGHFRPDAEVTRAEAAALILRALHLGPENAGDRAAAPGEPAAQPGAEPAQPADPTRPEALQEVPMSAYVERARSLGLLAPHRAPDQPATRAEVAIMAVRALEQRGVGLREPTDERVFNDLRADAEGYREIRIAHAHNLIQGYPDGTFRPNDTITRAEAAMIVGRLVA